MASRYRTPFKERKAGRSGGVVPTAQPGTTPSEQFPGEKTANWSSAGPAGPMPFNKGTRFPVVKTRAAKQGID